MTKNLSFVFVFILGIIAGSVATNAIVSSAAVNLARDKFYQGMSTFCAIAPPQPGSQFANMYSEQECRDILNQAIASDYYEQSLNAP